ncbi:hypothetical protein TURU_167193 [Turdus rufiventris]|nr:hypothetical protein TURU_167193 [Turdus rufiventris]
MLHLSEAFESSQLSSMDLDNMERMRHLKEAWGTAFQNRYLKTDYSLSLTLCQGLDELNIWEVMGPTNHWLPTIPLRPQEDSMHDFNPVFITCCTFLTVLICVVIDVSRLGSDRVSDLIEINSALL